jgi:hypothetical protein
MSELENADIKNWDHLCIVCGKSVDEGGGMCHIKAGRADDRALLPFVHRDVQQRSDALFAFAKRT